ncbi:MAG: carbohydrate kinase family protein [Mycobacteriales bacterium]
MTELRRFADIRCVVFGSYVADCAIQTATLPSWDDDIRAQSIVINPGGKAANQAVALARMGAQVSAVGVIGGDAVGADIMDHLRSNQVDTSGVYVKPTSATPVCLVFNGQRGKKSITWSIAEELQVSVKQAQESEVLIAEADVIILTFELPLTTISSILQAAHKYQKKVVLNAAPCRSAIETADANFSGVTALVVNEREAHTLFGYSKQLPDEFADMSTFAGRHGIDLVCVTRGAAGCSYWYAGQLNHHPGLPVAVQDSVGAGDAFVATLALYQAAGYEPATAIRGACTAGGLAAESPGALSSMPTHQQLRRRLAEWSHLGSGSVEIGVEPAQELDTPIGYSRVA